jgi:hypothetical protein
MAVFIMYESKRWKVVGVGAGVEPWTEMAAAYSVDH